MRRAHKRVAVTLAWQDPGHAAGIAKYAARAGWTLQRIFCLSLQEMRDFRPHGIICQLYSVAAEMVKVVQAMQVPVVELSDAVPGLVVPRVMPDKEAEGKAAAEHLIGRGFTRLVCVGEGAYGQHVGFVKAAQAAGLSPTVVGTNDPAMRRMMARADGYTDTVHDASPPPRRAWARSFFSELQKPVGVHTTEVAWAADIIEGCHAAGILVPEQVAVVSSTTYPHEGQAYPVPLTSIASNFELQGYQAAELLDRMLDGETIAADTALKVPPYPIEVRESTMCHATDNLPVARAATFIMRNLHDQNLSAKQICFDKGVSRSVLYKDFRSHFKMPIARYVEKLRVEDAKELLATSNASVETLATKCGFGEALRFHRAFKRVTGTSPGRYRKKHTAISDAAHLFPTSVATHVARVATASQRVSAFQPARPLRAESRAESILKCLCAGVLSASVWAKQCGCRTITGAFMRSVHGLLDTGAIERTIPDKPNSRLQQYRLTENGRRQLAGEGHGPHHRYARTPTDTVRGGGADSISLETLHRTR